MRSSSIVLALLAVLACTATASAASPPPPGANLPCRPTAVHPEPVILVHGTAENMFDNWQAMSPALKAAGYCVYAFNYGSFNGSGTLGIYGIGPIDRSAQELATEVSTVLAQTGAAKVDLVGHSQGGMMPRYYLKFDGGTAHVDKLVALAPSNHGTTLDGLTALVTALGAAGLVNGAINALCTACGQQEAGSPFLTNLNAGGETVAGVSYTVIESRYDEVVTPYTSAFLSGSGVTNILLQNQCALDLSDHLEIAADPVALADVLNALDPAHPVRVPCLTVLAITGPVGPVPSF